MSSTARKRAGVLRVFLLQFTLMYTFSITYKPPYSPGTRVQYFNSKQDALRMIAFYQSCGTKAYLNR